MIKSKINNAMSLTFLYTHATNIYPIKEIDQHSKLTHPYKTHSFNLKSYKNPTKHINPKIIQNKILANQVT